MTGGTKAGEFGWWKQASFNLRESV